MQPDHGTRARYQGSRTRKPCRCKPCVEANRLYMRERRDGGAAPVAQHGTRSKYNAGCKCEACVISNREFQREYMRAARGHLWTNPRPYNRKSK